MANEKKGLVDITTGAEVANANANGILDLTSTEVSQIANMGTTTISSTQWGYIGAMDQGVSTVDGVSFNDAVISDFIGSIDDSANSALNVFVNTSGLTVAHITYDPTFPGDATVTSGVGWQSFTPTADIWCPGIAPSIKLSGQIGTLWIYEGNGVGGALLLTMTGVSMPTPNTFNDITFPRMLFFENGQKYTWAWERDSGGYSFEQKDGYAGGVNNTGIDYLFKVYSATVAGIKVDLTTGNTVVSEQLDIDGGIKVIDLTTANGIVQTDASGNFSSSVTLPDGTLATTQPPGNSTTKASTTDFVQTGGPMTRAITTVGPRVVGDKIRADGGLIVGTGVAGVDYDITFDGENGNGKIIWLEDEGDFRFQHQTLDTPTTIEVIGNGAQSGSAKTAYGNDANAYVETTANATSIAQAFGSSITYWGINQPNQDVDIRIGGTTNDNAIVFDAANERLGFGTFTPQTTLDIQGGQTGKVTTVNVTTYDLLVTDYILNVTYTSTGAVAVNLPSAQATSGRIVKIKDSSGNSGTNNITINAQGGTSIDGSATVVINGDFDSVSLYADGSNWFIY